MDSCSYLTKLMKEVKIEENGNYLESIYVRDMAPIPYGVVDKEEEIILRLDLPGIETHPKEKIDIDINPWSLEVNIKGYLREYCLKICRFSAKIDARRSRYIRAKDALFLKLHKAKPGKWDHLSYHHPDVLKNFKKNFTKYIKSSSVFRDRDTSRLFDVLVIEILSNSGVEFRRHLIDQGFDLPQDVITIEQILKFLKSKIQQSSPESEFGLLATAFFLYEKHKFEENRPDAYCEYDRRLPKSRRATNKEAENMWNEGRKALKRSVYHEALEAFSKAINLDPKCPTYYVDRSGVYFALELYQNCINDATLALAHDSFNVLAHMHIANCFLIKFLPIEANIELRKAKILDPSSTEIDKLIVKALTYENYINMYTKAVRSGDKKAKETYLKSITNIVNPSVASEALLKVICDEGLISEAKKETSNLSFVHKNRDYMKFNFMAICSYYEDDEKKFQENFQKAKKLRPTSTEKEYCSYIADMYSYWIYGDKSYELGEYDDAIDWYSKGLDTSNLIPLISSKLNYKIACAYSKLKDVDEILFHLDEAIEDNNEYHEAFAARGEQYMRQKKFEKALHDFEKANKISPCARYYELIQKAKLKQPLSRETFEDYPVDDKRSSRNKDKKTDKQLQLAFSKKEEGNEHFTSKRYEEAIVSYSEAIDLDSSNPVYYSNRAACRILLKHFNEGLNDSKEAVSLDPTFAKGLFRMGQCHVALGRSDQAIYSFEKARKLKPDDNTISTELTGAHVLKEFVKKAYSAFTEEDYKCGEEFFSLAISKAEACVQLRLKRMECLIYMELFNEAISEADSISCLDPFNYKANYLLAICYFNYKDYENALDYLESSFALDHRDRPLNALQILMKYKSPTGNLTFNKAKFLEIKSKLLEDMKLLEKDENTDLINCEDDDLDQNDEELFNDFSTTERKALSQAAANSQLFIERAICYMEMKNYEEALAMSKEAVKTDNKCVKGFILIGEYNLIFGNVEEAYSAFKTAENLDPSNKEVIAGLDKTVKLKNYLNDAEISFKEEKYLSAYGLYSCAAGIAQRNSSLLLNIAECLIKLQKFSDLSNFVNSVNLKLRESSEYFCIKGLSSYHSHYNDDDSINSIKIAISKDSSNEKYRKYLDIIESIYDQMTKAFDAFQSHKFSEAFDLFQEIFKIDPSNHLINSEAHYYSGIIMLKQNEVLEAVKCFSNAISMREKYICALEKRALCYKKLNRISDAIEDYKILYNWSKSNIYKQMAYDLQKKRMYEFI